MERFHGGSGSFISRHRVGTVIEEPHLYFWRTNPNKTTVTRQLYRDDAKIQYDMMPTARGRAGKLTQEGRVALTRELCAILSILPAPGLSAIKETDLYEKVNQIIPMNFLGQFKKPSAKAKATEDKRRTVKNEKKRTVSASEWKPSQSTIKTTNWMHW